MAILSSCSDKWDDHYDASTVDNGTLWQAIASNAELSNFARVVEACGYDLLLDGSQTFTVFAPTNATFTQAEADSLIAEYRRQAAGGTRTGDNTVVRQFLQNHIALFRHPVSSLTNDSITMMNSKYEVLTSQLLGDRSLTSSNALYSNGLLFTLGGKLAYFPNVFEYLGHDAELDSVYQFFNRYSVYEFLDSKSVPGEIVDGLTVYLDSVFVLSNQLLYSYGLINSEDSTYWMLCPTNSEWRRLLAEYEPYFNYANNVSKRDSLVYTATRSAIMGGTCFSRTVNPEPAFRDSAVSTQASSYLVRQLLGETESYYIFPTPFATGGIFDQATDVTCSNGHVLKTDHFSISKYNTFMQTIKVEGESIIYQDTIVNAIEPLVVRDVTSDNPFYGKVSGNQYVEVVPETATAKVTAGFKIPNVLSAVPYDIYVVLVPPTAYDPSATEEATKPNVINSLIHYADQNGHRTDRPNNRNITTTAGVVDTVLLASNYVFPTCSYGLGTEQVSIDVRSQWSTRQTATHSGTLRIDCILLKPHEPVE